MNAIRIIAAGMLAPLAVLILATGLSLVAGWDRLLCELPEMTIFVTSRKWSNDESPTMTLKTKEDDE